MTVLIADKRWHGSSISGSGSPTLNYSVSYEVERPVITEPTVRARFTITMRSLYSDCWFDYPLYCKVSLNNTEYTITSKFGSGVKSVSYTTDWISFSNTGTSQVVGFTPRCGDLSHTYYDEGTIYFSAMEEAEPEIVYPTITSVSDFNLGDSLTVYYSNPSGLNIMTGVYDTYGSHGYSPYRSCSGSSYTFNFTDEELDDMYKAMGDRDYLDVAVFLSTSNYSSIKLETVKVYLTGNQKTGHTNVNGNWKRTKRYVNVNGTWKRAVRWVNVGGEWRRTI